MKKRKHLIFDILHFTFSQDTGVTLIEVLLAVVLIGVLSAALIQLGITALKGANTGKMRSVAVELTKEGIEKARVERDQNSETFFASYNGFYSLDGGIFFGPQAITSRDDVKGNGTFSPNGYPTYFRVIEFSSGTTQKTVTVTTYWQEGSSYNYVDMATVLTKWR